ncbi:hypothetical protein MTO96_010608 [Rhipicephalus appendiculatus]
MISSQLNRTEDSTTPAITTPVHVESTTTPIPVKSTTPVHVESTTTPTHLQSTTTPVHVQSTATTVHVKSTTTPVHVLSTTTPTHVETSTTTPVHVKSTTTPVHVKSTTTPVHVKSTTTTGQVGHTAPVICLFSRRLPNLPLAAQLCPYMAYMGLMHHANNDRFYINDDAGLYQFLALGKENVRHLIIATAPMHSHLLTQLRETFLHDGVARLMYSISRDQPLEALHGVMLLATSVVYLDSLHKVSSDIRSYLHTKMHLKLYLAVQTVGYNTSFDPLVKLKSSCDQLILYTNPFVPSPHCKIMPIIYQDLDALDKTFFKSEEKGESVPCITLNLAVRRYQLVDGKSDFHDDCAKEYWEKYSETCPDKPGVRGSTMTSAYLKTSENMLVFEDERSIERKLSQLMQINPSICVMATAIEMEDWNHECTARPVAASRMLAIAKYGGAETATPPSQTNGVLICVVEKATLIEMLPGSLCTHLVYSSVHYRLGSEHMYVADDGTAFYAASDLATKSGMHFLSEIDLTSFSNINVEHAFTGFLTSSTQWIQETHQDGLAFINVPNKTDNTKFESIIKKTWEHISTLKLKQMLLVGIDYRDGGSADLAKSLSGVAYPSRPQTDEDSALMKKVEFDSGSATTPCVSFNMAVRAFHGVNNTSCHQEEWAKYSQVCKVDTVTEQGKFGNYTIDGNVFMFETTASIKDRISRVSSEVKAMCAAVFELYFEDTSGSCASDGVAFPRVRYIQQEMAGVTKIPDTTTEMEPTATQTGTKTSDTTTEIKPTVTETITFDTSTKTEPTVTETITFDTSTKTEPTVTERSKETNTPWWWQTPETRPGGSSKPTPWWEKSEEVTRTKHTTESSTTEETHSHSGSSTTEKTHSHSESSTTEETHSHSEGSTTAETQSHSGSSTTEETHSHSETPWWWQTPETRPGGSSKQLPWWEETTHETKSTSSKPDVTTMTASSEKHETTETEPTTAATSTQKHDTTETEPTTAVTSTRVLLCITASVNIGNLLQLGLCTGLVYSAISYDIEMEKFDLKNDDIGELQKLRNGNVPFIATEVDTRGIMTSKVRRVVTDFFTKTEEFLATNNLDGIAFSATHQDGIDVEPFATEFWNRSREFQKQPLVIIILEFEKIHDSQALAYALTGKCQYLILRKQNPRPPSSTCAPRFPNRPLETNEEMEMKYLEERSRNMTSICLSFTLAVLNFHGVKNQGHGKVCEKELWVGYDKVCHLKNMPSASAYELKEKDNGTEIFSYEAEQAMREKVSKVTGQVNTLCAAAFDVEFEDVEGKCRALGGAIFKASHSESCTRKRTSRYTISSNSWTYTWHFQHTNEILRLIVGVDHINPFETRVPREFAGYCDFLILMAHPREPPSVCAVDFPSRVYEEADYQFDFQLWWESRGHTTACFSVNLAVRSFLVAKRRETEICTKESLQDYAVACNATIDHPLQNSTLTEIKYLPGKHQVVSYEGTVSLEHTVSILDEKVDDLCVAAFRVDLDDPNKECATTEESLPRLSLIRSLLNPKNVGAGSTEASTEASVPAIRSHRSTKKHALICVTTSADTLLFLSDSLCTHLVYSSVSYDKEGHSYIPASVDSRSIDPSSKGTAHKNAPQELADWVHNYDLDGIAIFMKADVNESDEWPDLADRLSKQFHTDHAGLMLVVGIDMKSPYRTALSEAFTGKADFLVLITNIRQPETPCKVGFPSRPHEEIDTANMGKIVQLSKNATVPCVTFNLAVRKFHLVQPGYIGDSCDEEHWVDYAETCRTTPKNGNNLYETRYTSDDSDILTYEGKVFIQQKMSYMTGFEHDFCVTVFEVDRENPTDNCPSEGGAFWRLRLISEYLVDIEKMDREMGSTSSTPNDVTVKTVPREKRRDATPRKLKLNPRFQWYLHTEFSLILLVFRLAQADTKEPFTSTRGDYVHKKAPKFSLICVASMVDTLHYLVDKVCNYVVYSSVAYKDASHKFVAANARAFHSFLALKKGIISSALLTEVNTLKSAGALDDEHKAESFIRALLNWMRKKELDGVMLSYDTFVTNAETFKTVAKKVWHRFQKTPVKPVLVIGVNYKSHETSLSDELTGNCDFLILMTHARKPESHCKVGLPSKLHTMEDSDYMVRLLEASRNMTSPCVSVNMAVRDFFIGKAAEEKENCKDESWIQYNAVCGIDTERTDGMFEVARTKNNTNILTFESKVSIQHRMSMLLGEVPNFCVAAFGVDMEDAQNDCPSLGKPFSRLLHIKSLLSTAKEAYKLRRRVPLKGKRKAEHDTPRNIICIHDSSGPSLRKAVMKLCDYIVLAFVRLDVSGVPVSGELLEDFLAVTREGKRRAVAALDPSFIDALNTGDTGFLRPLSTKLKRWTSNKKLAGLALIPLTSTDIHAVAEFSNAIWSVFQHSVEDRKILIVGVHAFEAEEDVLQRLSRNCDFLVFINQEVRPGPVCRMHYPAMRRLVYQDFEHMKNISSAVSRSCLSVNLAVLGFRMARSSDQQVRIGDRCVEQKWTSLSEVCPTGSEEETIEPGLEGLVQSNSSYVMVFETKRTTYDKVVKFRQAHPDGCVAVFGFNFDDLDGHCKNERAFPRVRLIADVMSKNSSSLFSTATKYKDEHAKEPEFKHSSLLCVFSEAAHLMDNFPGELCNYLVFQSVEYMLAFDRVAIHNEAAFRKFKHLPRNSGTWMLAAITQFSWLKRAATRSVFTNLFVKATKRWVLQQRLHGIAMFPEAPLPPKVFLEVTKRTYWALKNKPTPLGLVIGVPAKEHHLTTWKRLSRFSDVLVFTMHRSVPSDLCQITFPSVEPFSSRHLEEMAIISRNERHRAVVCMSVNLAVQHFRTRKHALVGDRCVHEEWEDYSQACADDGSKAVVNWEWLSAISSNVTVTRTFEVPRTLTMKANQFLRLNPKGCLAAFNVDYDDPHGTCPGKQPFARISTLANLRHASGSRHRD